MSVTAESVRTLRERTGAGMMECKKALVETSGDLDAAAELMRKQGLAKADKKAARIAAEGRDRDRAFGRRPCAAMAEINCETDFVAREQDFRNFAADVVRLSLAHKPVNVEALLAAELAAGESVDTRRRALVAKIGENISVRRATVLETSGPLGAYVHGIVASGCWWRWRVAPATWRTIWRCTLPRAIRATSTCRKCRLRSSPRNARS